MRRPERLREWRVMSVDARKWRSMSSCCDVEAELAQEALKWLRMKDKAEKWMKEADTWTEVDFWIKMAEKAEMGARLARRV